MTNTNWSSHNRKTTQVLYNNYVSNWTVFHTRMFDGVDVCKELYLLLQSTYTSKYNNKSATFQPFTGLHQVFYTTECLMRAFLFHGTEQNGTCGED